MESDGMLAETTSLCPDCLEHVPGHYEEHNDGVFLTRQWADQFGLSPEFEGREFVGWTPSEEKIDGLFA